MEAHALPCFVKSIFHVDCPGCGFQRAVLLLGKGQVQQSWHQYPPTIPILLLFTFGLLHLKFNFSNGAKIITTGYLMIAMFVFCNYVLKLLHPFLY
jgi:hypothetical protein